MKTKKRPLPRRKKPSKLTLLKREVKALKSLIEVNHNTITRVAAERDKALLERDEARRRTIPMLGSFKGSEPGDEVNFLPLGIEQIQVDYDTHVIRSLTGREERVQGRARATIIARGDIVYFPKDGKVISRA